MLSSPGGALAPALAIGKTIQLKGFSTLVTSGSECSSACALVWVAGTQRFAGESSRIGFHASYRDNNGRLEEVGVANAVIGRYLTLLNLSEKAVIFATSASPTSILWLDANLAREIGMQFETIDGDDSEAIAHDTPTAVLAENNDMFFNWEQDNWGVQGKSAGCALFSYFVTEGGKRNESMLMVFRYHSNPSEARLAFFNEKFRSVSQGRSYRIKPIFYAKSGPYSRSGPIDFGGMELTSSNGLSATLEWGRLREDLAKSDSVSFVMGDEAVDQFPLEGSSQAIEQFDRCMARNQKLADPFAD